MNPEPPTGCTLPHVESEATDTRQPHPAVVLSFPRLDRPPVVPPSKVQDVGRHHLVPAFGAKGSP